MTILTWPKWYGKLVESGLNYIPYSTTDVYIITEELPTASWTSFLLILPIILLRHRNLCRKKRCMVLPPDLNNCFWCDQRQIESSGIFFFYIHFVFLCFLIILSLNCISKSFPILLQFCYNKLTTLTINKWNQNHVELLG